MIYKIILALFAFLFGRFASACEISHKSLMKYEEQVLHYASKRQLFKVTEPLACILEIQDKGEGDLRYLANSFLRPIFGGPQINGVPTDRRYKVIADQLTKISKHAGSLDSSVMAAHARGSWHFYKLFCEQGDIEYCATMLPSEDQVNKESELLAATSMLTLRNAYYKMTGKQREEIATRLKDLHRKLPLERNLKRKVIDQIYTEIFAPEIPLSIS